LFQLISEWNWRQARLGKLLDLMVIPKRCSAHRRSEEVDISKEGVQGVRQTLLLVCALEKRVTLLMMTFE
jgi:hypothetical protein